MRKSSLPSYVFGHFTVDFACGYILYRMISKSYIESEDAVWLVIAYNIIAFGTQFIFGILSDLLHDNGRIPAVSGCLICALGLIIGPENPVLTGILIGVGNSLFHVGGGTDSLTRINGMSRAGIFVSSGALGIAMGCHIGSSNLIPVQIPVSLLCFAAACIWVFCPGKRETLPAVSVENDSKNISRAKKSLLGDACIYSVFIILIAVFIRSWAGYAALSPESESKYAWLLPAAAAFAGKFAGGILADTFGARRIGTFAILISAPLFFLGTEKYLFFLAATFFFNIAMPITLCELSKRFPRKEGFAFGLTTLALLLGYLLNTLLPKAEEEITLSQSLAVPVACLVAAAAVFLTSDNVRHNLEIGADTNEKTGAEPNATPEK